MYHRTSCGDAVLSPTESARQAIYVESELQVKYQQLSLIRLVLFIRCFYSLMLSITYLQWNNLYRTRLLLEYKHIQDSNYASNNNMFIDSDSNCWNNVTGAGSAIQVPAPTGGPTSNLCLPNSSVDTTPTFNTSIDPDKWQWTCKMQAVNLHNPHHSGSYTLCWKHNVPRLYLL